MKQYNQLASAILLALVMASAGRVHAAQAVPPKAEGDAAAEVAVQDAASAKNLDAVSVQADFIQSNAKSAMKLDVPVSDIPFTVASYSSEFMSAVGSTRLGDMFNYMVGVARSGNSANDITIRGFGSNVGDRNTVMVDGLPGMGSRGGTPSTANIDHIEVVKGPASVLYGRAQPGGFVNLITKKPLSERKGEIDVRLDTFAGGGPEFGDTFGSMVTADFTGPLDNKDRFLYRFIAEYGDNDSYRDFVGTKSLLIAPSLTWNISERTSATLALDYRTQDAGFDSGLSAPLLDIGKVASITTRYQEPGDHQKDIGKVVSLNLAHKLSEDWSYNLGIRAVRNSDEIIAFESQSVRPDLVTVRRTDRHQYNQRAYYTLDNSFSGYFDTGAVKHNLIVGATVGRETSDTDRKRFFTTPVLDIDLYRPVYGGVAPAVQPPQSRRKSASRSTGVYATDLITLSDHWKAVLGVRYEREAQNTREVRLAPSGNSSTNGDVLPMAGLMFQPSDEWSVYLSYSTSFTPPAANARPVDGTPGLVPQTGKQVETGVKFESADRKATGTFSLFRIDKENVLISAGGGFYTQVGAERVNGAEFEFNIRPLENLQLGGGYAFIDSEIVDDPVANLIGSPLTNSPKHSANLLAQYDFGAGPLERFGVSAGLVYRSGRIGTLPTATSLTTLALPSYFLADVSIHYRSYGYDIALKLGNVFDEKYFRSADTAVRIYPGDPRHVALTFKKHF